MRELPLSLESLHVGVIYEVYGEKYQLIKGYKGRPHTFDLVMLGGPHDGKIYSEYTFKQVFWNNKEHYNLWCPEPILSLEDML